MENNEKDNALLIKTKKKRSWRNFKKIFKNTEYYSLLDLRKKSENAALCITTKCCGDKLEVRKVKDFPLEDRICKCGKSYIIRWTNI